MPQSLTMNVTISHDRDDTQHEVRITVDYNDARAAVAALVKLGEPWGQDMLIRAFIDNEDVQWTE